MAKTDNTTPSMGNSMSIVGGKWTERVQEGTEGATSRVLTKGKNEGSAVWEIGYSNLADVKLVSAALETSEHIKGLQLNIVVQDVFTAEQYPLTMSATSKYAKAFISVLPNLNQELPFNLELHLARGKTATGADKYNLRVYQNGKALESAYIKWSKDANGENNHTMLLGCPDATQKRDGSWDFDAQNEFLWDALETFLKEDFVPFSGKPIAQPIQEDDDRPDLGDEHGEEEDGDDIPF